MGDRYRSTAFWMIVVALVALLWGAPVGLSQFALTAWPTRLYYAVLISLACALLVCGARVLYVRRLNRALASVGCLAAFLLAINQATALTFKTILCFTPG